MNKFKLKLTTCGLPIWITTALVSDAVILPGANGANGSNTSIEDLKKITPEFSYYNNVVGIGGGAGVYLGESVKRDVGYVLTADHLGSSKTISVNGSSYDVISGEQIDKSDLKLYTIQTGKGGNLPDLPSIQFATLARKADEDVLMFGRGTRKEGTDKDPNTSDMVKSGDFNVYNWGAATSAISFGTNKVSTLPLYPTRDTSIKWTTPLGYQDSTFFLNFDDPGAGNYNDSYEGIAGAGDSGGPIFVKENGLWKLAGITSFVMKRGNQPERTAAFGNSTGIVDLSKYNGSFPTIYQTPVPEPSTTILLIIGTGTLLTYRNRSCSYTN